jgi:hypothetical protein
MKLARGLEHPGFGAFGEDDPLGMPLQLLDNTADETHGR